MLRKLAAGLLLAVLCTPAWSQVGFVDFDRVFAESRLGREQKEKLDAEAARYSRELEQLSSQARTLEDDLTRNAVTMSAEERTRKDRDLRVLAQRFQQKKTEFSEEYEQFRKEAIDSMVGRIHRMVERIAKAEKIDLVVNRAVAVSLQTDLTAKVVKAIDEEAR
jgi:Skp family chaperone for outer membrane proteins